MKEFVEKVKQKKALVVLLAVVLVVVLAVVTFQGFEKVRARQVAEKQAQVKEERTKDKVQQEAFQMYFQKRFSRLEKLQKKRARTYSHPNKSERNLSVAAIFVDHNGDSIPDMVIDQPALQYERQKGNTVSVNYDGMYMGNVQVALYVGGKIQVMPQNPRKKLLRKKRDISSTVYVADDGSKISVVIRTGGEESMCDGYLYKVTDTGLKEISRKCKVREHMQSESTKGSYKSAPGYNKFLKKYVLEDATVYKEELSYDKDGNMRHYDSLNKYREAVGAWGGTIWY
jgi:hypothetical protein